MRSGPDLFGRKSERGKKELPGPQAPAGDSPGASGATWNGVRVSAGGLPASAARARESLRELSLMAVIELSNELSVRMDPYEIAEVTLFNLMGHFGCSRSALWILPESNQDAVLLRAHGLSPKIGRAIGAVWSKWLFGRPGGELEPVLVSDLEDLTVPGLSLAEEAGLAVFVPITAQRRRIGLLALGKRVTDVPFSGRDLDMLAASLNFVGVSLENTALYANTMESNRGLRLANERLLELDRLKSEFLRTLNHELRTPLTVISAYVDSLLMGDKEDGPRRQQLTTLRDEAQKLEAMVINLLDFRKLLDHQLELDPEPGDVIGPIRAWYEERRPGVAAHLRELRFSHASSVPPAFHERQRLLQIVDCLVGNALKFCPAGSLVQVRIEPDTLDGKEWVRIDVEDNGPGIPSDRLPHLWDSFRPGDGSETRQHGGMGIGLAFAKRLAEEMGGRLDVESELGRGAIITLRPTTG